MSKRFHKPKIFPNEAFIQESIENHFENQGYIMQKDGHIDLIATRDDEVWIIEAKGITSEVGTDFNTCLGQLAKSMTSEKIKYGIAIPNHIQYKRQCELISSYFRQLVKLHILLVNEDSQVDIIYPHQDLRDFKF